MTGIGYDVHRFAEGRPGVIVVEATGIRDIPSGPLLRIGHDRYIPGLRQRWLDQQADSPPGADWHKPPPKSPSKRKLRKKLRKLVKRKPDSHDRRRVLVELTPKELGM